MELSSASNYGMAAGDDNVEVQKVRLYDRSGCVICFNEDTTTTNNLYDFPKWCLLMKSRRIRYPTREESHRFIPSAAQCLVGEGVEQISDQTIGTLDNGSPSIALDLKLEKYHIVALRTDRPAIEEALKVVNPQIMPKLRADHRAETLQHDCQ